MVCIYASKGAQCTIQNEWSWSYHSRGKYIFCLDAWQIGRKHSPPTIARTQGKKATARNIHKRFRSTQRWYIVLPDALAPSRRCWASPRRGLTRRPPRRDGSSWGAPAAHRPRTPPWSVWCVGGTARRRQKHDAGEKFPQIGSLKNYKWDLHVEDTIRTRVDQG